MDKINSLNKQIEEIKNMKYHICSKKGHNLKNEPGGYGGYQAIMKLNNVYYGASESRKDGHASGY